MGGVVSDLAFPVPPRERNAEVLLVRRDLVWLTTASNGRIPAVHIRQKVPSKFTILYSHRNAEDLGGSLGHLQLLASTCQCDVLGYEYAGYGISDAECCSEEACYESVDAAFAYLQSLSVLSKNIVAYGDSIGSGPAVDLAARYQLGGLALRSPLLSGAKAQLGEVAATVGYAIDIFKNYEKIARVACPVLVMHGLADTVVPCEHGEAIFEAARHAVKPLWIEGGGHNCLPIRDCVQRVREFLEEIQPAIPKLSMPTSPTKATTRSASLFSVGGLTNRVSPPLAMVSARATTAAVPLSFGQRSMVLPGSARSPIGSPIAQFRAADVLAASFMVCAH